MILRTFRLTLDRPGMARVSSDELRRVLAARLDAYVALHPADAATFIHRYPVVQYKRIDDVPTVIGINEGADTLLEISRKSTEILPGVTITGTGAGLLEEAFGISDTPRSYEFATPWLGLNQENYRKFFKLKGKPERDVFIRKMLAASIATMAKTLNCPVPAPVSCEVNLHFTKERLDGVSVMSFTGKFQADFLIPDYLGIGKSVGRGFGAVRQVPAKMPDRRED
jgi:hypothetical protein